MKHVAVVTTFSRAGWDQYAHRMVQSFLTFWPKCADLHVYPDEEIPAMPTSHPRLHVHLGAIPEKDIFLRRYKANQFRGIGWPVRPDYNYRFDVAKFCHKPYALWDFMTRKYPHVEKRYSHVIWLDADTLTHSRVPPDAVNKMTPDGVDFLYLGRTYKYSECGFMVFRMPTAIPYMERVIDYYEKGTFRQEREWHDSYLFDQARIAMKEEGAPVRFQSLTNLHRKRGGGHPFVNSFLGNYMDHLKGDARKATGKPRPQDMIVGHQADYWKANR